MPHSLWNYLRRRFAHPLTSAVLLAILIYQLLGTGAAALERWRVVGILPRPLTVAEARAHIRSSPSPHGLGFFVRYVIKSAGGLYVHHPNNESWDTVARALMERPRDVLTAEYRSGWRERGLWAVTRFDSVDVIVVSGGEALTDAERVEARRMVARSLRQSFGGGFGPPPFDQRDVERHTVRWRGYADNALTLIALVGLPFSLRWIPAALATARRERRIRALRRQRCFRCGYSLAGLSDPRCPECGEDLSPDPKAAAPR